MIFTNHLQETSLCVRPAGRRFNELGPTVPTAADVLRFLQRFSTAGPLLSPIIRLAKHLPALSGNILELHFRKSDNSVDFATRLNVNFDTPLIAGMRSENLSLPFLNNDFTALINQKKCGFHHGIENIWIEYDAPFRNAPALFFDINKREAFCPQSSYVRLQKVAGIFGRGINKRLSNFLEQIKEAGLCVVYYGLMFSRNATAVRLTINGIHQEHLADTLKNLGWKGAYEDLKKIRDTYLANGQNSVVAVDFENHLEARIGIEVFDENRTAFIQTLYSTGHITKAHLELLSDCEQTFALSNRLATALTELHQRPVTELHTRLNHFKFVAGNTDAIAAKGYLYYCF